MDYADSFSFSELRMGLLNNTCLDADTKNALIDIVDFIGDLRLDVESIEDSIHSHYEEH